MAYRRPKVLVRIGKLRISISQTAEDVVGSVKEMTQDQVFSLIRAVLLSVGIFIIGDQTGNGHVSATDWATLSAGVLAIVPVIWSMFAHARSQAMRALVGSTK